MRYSLRIAHKLLICLAVTYLYFLPICFFAAQVETQKKLEYEVTVTLKLVQVYVLDKHGNAVVDLTKSDFELYDDGQAKTVTDFEKHELSLNQVPRAPQPPVPAAVASNTSRKFFFFFDFAFNSVGGISKSRKAALDFLDTQVRRDDLVGVLSFTAGRGLILHEYLTSDHLKIRQVIEGFGTGNFLGRAWRMQSEGLKELLAMESAMTSSLKSKGGEYNQTKRTLEAERSTMENRVVSFVSQISEMAKTFQKIPGIKNIILFSSGIPNFVLYGREEDKYAGEDGLDILQRRKLVGNSAIRDQYDEMIKELSGSNSAVYAINVSRAGAAPFEESDMKGDGALRHLGRDSGGKYFDNINVYEDINRSIQKATGTYYVLGYYIDEKQDGRFHNVRVKAKRKGCAVFGQKGYFDPKPFSEYSENEKLLHIMDLALAEDPLLQDPAEVPLTALPIVDRGKPAVIVILSLPHSLVSSALGSRAGALCLIFHEKGEAASSVPLQIMNPDLEKEFIQIIFIVPAIPGRAICRVALCNMKTGYGVRGFQNFATPEASEVDLRLDPPLFLTDGRVAGVYAPSGTQLENLYAYDPQEYSVLTGDLPAGTKMLRAALRATSIRPIAGIELTARLTETGGAGSESVPVSILREFSDGPTNKLLVDMELGELKPGLYMLSLIAREKNGPASAWTAATITVK